MREDDDRIYRQEEPPGPLFSGQGEAEGLRYYLLRGGQRLGPLRHAELLAAGMERDSLVWFEGCYDWQRADEVPQLRDLMRRIPPPPARSPFRAGFQTPMAYRPGVFATLYGWYLGLLIASAAFFALAIFFAILYENSRTFIRNPWGGAFFRRNPTWEALAILALLAGIAFTIANLVLYCVLLFKMWNQIQDGHAQASPGMAVGFLFIPVFNVYWNFVALHGLGQDLNRYLRRHRLPGRRMPVGIALAACIVFLIPYVNVVSVFILLPIALAFLRTTSEDIAAARVSDEYGR